MAPLFNFLRAVEAGRRRRPRSGRSISRRSHRASSMRRIRSFGHAAHRWPDTRTWRPAASAQAHPHPDGDLHHPVRARGTMARASRRPSPPSRPGRKRSSAWPGTSPIARPCPRRRPRSASGWPRLFAAIGTLSAGWRDDAHGRARRRLDPRVDDRRPHLLPGDVQRPAGPPYASPPFRPDPRRRRGKRRTGRARRGDRTAVARFLCPDRASRVDGGSVALLGPHGPGTDDRRRGSPRTPSRRVLDLASGSSASPTHRSQNGEGNVTTFDRLPRAGNVCRQPDRRCGEPSPALPPRRGPPPRARTRSSARAAPSIAGLFSNDRRSGEGTDSRQRKQARSSVRGPPGP